MRKTVLLILVLVLIIAVFVTAIYMAREKIDRDSLVGSYVANVEKRTHNLELRPDGTYTHRFVGANGQKVENSGTWKFGHHDFDREPRVFIEGFITGIPRLDEAPIGAVNWEKRVYGMPIDRPLIGPVRLIVSWDYNYYFVKQKSED